MESELLVGWQDERAELRAELSNLQDELAESRAEREELESRAQALTDRLSQTLDPPLSFSLRLDDEHREWRKKLREGREREARQALLIHKLQNKVVEYRARCQALEQQVISEERELRARERLLRDERSDTLESTLIRLEEEQQRFMGLSEVNVLLRSQLSQSTDANDALRDDLRKLTADWSKAVEEVMQKEIEWQKEKESLTGHIGKEQTRLMTLWGRVVTLKRQCHSLKTATDKDLWELRAEASCVSSSLLSVWTSAQSALTLPLDSTATHPLSSTQGPLSLDDLENDLENDRSNELKVDLQSETLELRNRIAELNMTIKALESERAKQEAEMERRHRQEMDRKREQERKWEKQIELERNFESVRHAVRTLWRVVNSQQKSGQSNSLSVDDVSTEGLSSVLSIIAQAETALQWRQQEVQDAQISMRRLGAEKDTLEQKMAQLEREREELQEQTNQGALEIKHTQELLNSEREMVTSLHSQAEEAERLMEGLRKENEHMRRQREREEEAKIQMERERQKCVEAEMLEVTQLCERDTRSRLELHSLQGALEREKLDRERAEQEAAESKDSLLKARESLLGLSSSQAQLKRELAEGRDALERMAPLNEALAKDKRELSVRALQLETEVAEAQAQIQAFGSEMASLRRELKTASLEANDLREWRETEQKTLQQLRGRERELENKLDTEKEERVREVTALMEEKANNEQRIAEVSEHNNTVMKELQGVQAELLKSTEQQRRAEREREDLLRESQRLEDTICALESEKVELARVKEELGCVVVCLQEHMGQVQEQASGLEIQCSQLQTQVDTLRQTKDVLQGEIQCLQTDLQRETAQREREKQGAVEEKSSTEREIENWRSAFTKLQHDIEQTLEKNKLQEEDNKTEREKWQREREALNTELGQKDGEVEILRNRVDGLLKENEELLDLLNERNAELEKLQTKLAAEMKTAERRLKDAYGEIERWKQKENEIQRDKKELNHKLIERVEMESQNLKITERERANMSDLLKKKEDDVQMKEEAIEELKLKVQSLERVIDSLEIELKEKETSERRVAALEEHNVQLRQREIEKSKENENRQKTRDELETRLRGQLEQKYGELMELKSRVEELMREREHMSCLMKEREQDFEKLQTVLFTEKKTYELRLKEAKDNTDCWKRQAGDTGKEKEQVKLVLEREKAELTERLREREEELQKIEDNNEDLKGRIQSLEEILKKLKTDAEIKEIQFKLLHEQNSQIQEREIEKQREMERKLTELKEQEKQLRRELEDLKTKMEGVVREKERMLVREEKTEEEFQTKITKDQNIFEQKLKAEREEINRWKAKLAEIEEDQKSWKEREEKRRKIHEMEEREKERRLREELLQKEFELGQSRLKIDELNEENEQDKTTRLELQEDLKRQTTLLRESDEEVRTLKKSLQQKEKQERDRVLHEEEEMRSLREKLQEVEQKSSQLTNRLRETESAFEKEKHQRREKEEEFLDCKQELLLVRRERDQERENIEELQTMMDERSKELKMFTRKLDEKSEEVERLREDAQVLKASVEKSEEEKQRMKRSLSQIENDTTHLETQLRVEKIEGESLKARLGDLQKDQRILMKENTGRVQTLGARVKELEEERDGLSAELRRKEREIRDLKDEALRDRREKERLSSSLNEGKEKLETLQEEVVVLAKTKEKTRSKVKEHEEQNQKMREGLIAGLQEMATLKELLEESHREGERLRSMLQEKKDELVQNRDECVRATQAEVKDLLLKVQMLEKENKEFRTALRLQEEELKKNQEKRMQEKEEMNRREEKFEEELKVVESIAERKESELTRARARMDVLEQQRTELSSMAAGRSQDAVDLSLKIRELRQEVNGLKEDKIRENEEKQRAVEELELLRKTCSEKETELIKERREDETRNNERLQQDEERNAGQIRVLSERLKDTETELRSVRETAYKEESVRLKLQDKFEDEKRNTGRLKEQVEMLEKEKQELNTKFEEEMHNVRENKYRGAKVDSGHGTLTDINDEYHSHDDRWLEIETLRKELTRKGQEVEMMRIKAQSLQTDIDRWRKQSTSEKEDLERLKKQMSIVLLQKEERDRLLREKDMAVCALKEGAEELGKDRDRMRVALEKTEAMLIYYKERLGQQEHKRTQSGADVTQEKKTEPNAQAIDEADTYSGVQNRLSAMQQAVAQLEIEQNLLQRRNTHLEKKIERLRSERQHLRETLTQVELERGKLSYQLSQSEAGVQSLSGGTDKEELKRLRIRANELEEQVHHLRLMLAADHKQRAEFIDRSLKNSQSVMSLRQDLNESLAVVSQQLVPSVLKSETQKLDRSFREQELSLSLSQI